MNCRYKMIGKTTATLLLLLLASALCTGVSADEGRGPGKAEKVYRTKVVKGNTVTTRYHREYTNDGSEKSDIGRSLYEKETSKDGRGVFYVKTVRHIEFRQDVPRDVAAFRETREEYYGGPSTYTLIHRQTKFRPTAPGNTAVFNCLEEGYRSPGAEYQKISKHISYRDGAPLLYEEKLSETYRKLPGRTTPDVHPRLARKWKPSKAPGKKLDFYRLTKVLKKTRDAKDGKVTSVTSVEKETRTGGKKHIQSWSSTTTQDR